VTATLHPRKGFLLCLSLRVHKLRVFSHLIAVSAISSGFCRLDEFRHNFLIV
jgi:hypothetical protein